MEGYSFEEAAVHSERKFGRQENSFGKPEPSPEPEKKPAVRDKLLIEMAKRRIAEKRSLIWQLIDFCAIFTVMIMIANTPWINDRMEIALIFCSFWGLRLFIRIFKFMRPSFKHGVSAYFRERREHRAVRRRYKIEAEYNRLKKSKAEYFGELDE